MRRLWREIKGGQSFYNQQKNPRWKNLRLRLFSKRGKQCELCTALGSRLEIHHVIPRKERPDLAYNLDNLIILCSECHSWMEAKSGAFRFRKGLVDQVERTIIRNSMRNQ